LIKKQEPRCESSVVE